MSTNHDQPSALLDRASEAQTAKPVGEFDPLSDVLRTVRLRGALFFMIDATSPWCVDVPKAADFADIILPGARHVVSYHIALEGEGLASIPGQDPIQFSAGDVIVFPHADPYLIESERGAPPELTHEETLAFFEDCAAGRLPFVIPEGGGALPKAKFICGFLGCDLAPNNPLFGTLPRLMHIRRAASGSSDLLDRLIEMAMTEIQLWRAGGEGIRLGLSELMFIELLRRYLQALPTEGPGWLAGLRDPKIGQALTLLHAQPARNWSLDHLAREVGVSRSVLAERFTRFVGETPMRYLTNWRMQLAALRLADGNDKVATVGQQVGFHSEASFSRTFKRTMGLSPAQWRAAR